MPFEWWPAMWGLLAGAVPGLLGFWITRRQARDSEQRQIQREAAADLLAPLRDLRSLIRARGLVEVRQEEVASALVGWNEAFDRQKHRLPRAWPSLGGNVRAAAGEVFGGVVLVDISPDMGAYPLAEPNFVWQDNAETYFGHLINAVALWGDSRPVGTPLSFDPWLAKTGRHWHSRRGSG